MSNKYHNQDHFMMDNKPVIIEQVNNGFIVHEYGGRDSATMAHNQAVFQSFNELTLFLERQFSFRDYDIASDQNGR